MFLFQFVLYFPYCIVLYILFFVYIYLNVKHIVCLHANQVSFAFGDKQNKNI